MSDDHDARSEAMVEFLGSCFISLSGPPPSTLSELGDGVCLFEALSEIAPDHFDPTTIARDLGDNWALKSSNLRKLCRNLESYYHEILGKDADFDSIGSSISSIARHGDHEGITVLVELVAGAVVHCEDKDVFIGRIMNMRPTSQLEMKGIIESSLGRISDFDDEEGMDDDEEDDNEMFFGDEEEEDTRAAPDSIASPVSAVSGGLFSAMDGASLDADGMDYEATSELMKERDELRRALQDARRELAAHKSQAAILADDTENAQRKLRALAEDLQDRLARREEELREAEDEVAKSRRALEDAEASATELGEKNALLADDLDVANAKAAQLRKAEATVVAYRKKLEGVGVMNQQMTDLEDQAASYLSQIMDLENEVKKVPSLQKNVEELQAQVTKLEKERMDMDETLKSRMTDIDKLKGSVETAEGAKKMYEEELTELREQHEGVNEAGGDSLGSEMAGLGLTSSTSVNEAKEKTMRLEIENKKLKEKIEQLHKKAKEDEVAAAAVSAAASASTTSNHEVKKLKAEVSRLQQELKKKEAEKEKLGSDKEKLEAYTKKTLSKFQEKYLVALQECKAKLKEKHDKIESLEMRSASEKTAQKREERLLSSTIYELGLAIMQQRLKERGS
uniref:Calponin-homology (CH) domain-containing protein n=1 Tax=Helicotheca tamesis TaxID=374047 RepID=A0A7S2IHL6_9STRA|mmetsp:Transcript_952/g.1326  ORF Transcript_952/g.1326 Transcript_952/m.1326 type:complete len:625 (+) Transcript_952:137-2011(+)|eukprot:CAMPEP_0185729630 /NCGR_PEP_ID=MMETSP1171-20130828/6703_1 /TAXON_ID=374046 /ORGANISM="Helicotheca tamensis, Strain CCMP826" /LENGTH=624 /DNA_ID=CAMNT_0028398517 /DNA_START=66 /DNA_END=1940 /DNA_ORIENTATION=+